MKTSHFPNVAGFWPFYNNPNLIGVRRDSLKTTTPRKMTQSVRKVHFLDLAYKLSFLKTT